MPGRYPLSLLTLTPRPARVGRACYRPAMSDHAIDPLDLEALVTEARALYAARRPQSRREHEAARVHLNRVIASGMRPRLATGNHRVQLRIRRNKPLNVDRRLLWARWCHPGPEDHTIGQRIAAGNAVLENRTTPGASALRKTAHWHAERSSASGLRQESASVHTTRVRFHQGTRRSR